MDDEDMGLRLIVKTKNQVEQTGLMKIFDLVWDWGKNEYLFHDELMPEMFLWFFSNRVLGYKPPLPNDPEFISKTCDVKIFEKYGNLTDDFIIQYIEGYWFRPDPYWTNYKFIMMSYLLAKRDYIKKLAEAEIIDIRLQEEDPNPRNAIIKVTLQFESYVSDKMNTKEHLKSIFYRLLPKQTPELKIIDIDWSKKI